MSSLVSSQTVNPLSIACMIVSALLCFGIPIGLAIWSKVKYKKLFSFLPLLGGVLGFLFSQVLYRIPALQYVLPLQGWYQVLTANPWFAAAFLALTAGVVEEFARFAVCAIMEKHRRFTDGLSYGIGHGGIEAILLAGFAFVNNIILSFVINGGLWDAMVSAVPASQQGLLIQTGQTLVSTPSPTFLLGGFERLFAILIQIALSLLVFKGFAAGKKGLYLLLAILLHALVDFPAGLYAYKILNIGAWAMEGIVFVMAAAAAVYIVLQAREWRRKQAPQIPANG